MISLFVIGFAAMILGVLAAAVGIGFHLASPKAEAKPSDHFDGERFHHPWPFADMKMFDLVNWSFSRERGPWQDAPSAPGTIPAKRVSDTQAVFTNVGHATWLIQLEEFNLLTDPIWAERAAPFAFAEPKRHAAPGLRLEELPPIDVVLISHNHYDHLNVPTLLALEAAHHPLFITGVGNGWVLRNAGLSKVVELEWWEQRALPQGLLVTFVPAQHFSQRGFGDRNRTLWGGFVVKGHSEGIYFAGDTGYGPHFKMIAKRLGPPSVALLPIGAFKPRWLMRQMHLSPSDALSALRDLQAEETLVMHYGVFELADDGQHDALDELASTLKETPELAPKLHVVPFGKAWPQTTSGPAPKGITP